MSSDRPIRATQNLYQGVNAHLQSALLKAGRWAGYHGALINALRATLNRNLPEGYIAISEESIQMRRPDIHIEAIVTPPSYASSAKLPRPFQPDPRVQEAVLEQYIPVLEIEEAEWLNIALRHEESDIPIIWIEILSPSNKSGDKLLKYRRKRREILAGGTTFVEIDLIHGISTTLEEVADYDQPGSETQRHPYAIWFIDPKVQIGEEGRSGFASFNVNEAIPDVRMRLLGADTVLMQLGAAYRAMFATDPGWGRQIDYRLPPEDVHSYVQRRDRIAIAALMSEAERLNEAGADLDSAAPLTIPPHLIQKLEQSVTL